MRRSQGWVGEYHETDGSSERAIEGSYVERAQRDHVPRRHHVVAGKVMAADVVKMKDGSDVKTAGGKKWIGVKAGKVTVDGANVTKTDIEASNGVIHVIDTVIMPS